MRAMHRMKSGRMMEGRHHPRHHRHRHHMKDAEAMYLAALGDDDEDFPQLADDETAPKKSTFGTKTRVGITGIEAVDRVIFDVQDGVSDLKLAISINTAVSVFTLLGLTYLLVKEGSR